MFSLPSLPYATDALEPWIDARTMEIHHGKHHAGYVSKLNAAIEGSTELKGLPVHELVAGLSKVPEELRTAVRNNGGGHYNHSLFWQLMSPNGGGEAGGDLGRAIEHRFGSFGAFQEMFAAAAATRFGSGWAWLALDSQGTLQVLSTANQDNPITQGLVPVLTLDVWEHAYYLNYQNRRPEYVANWWKVVDWDTADRFYRDAGGR